MSSGFSIRRRSTAELPRTEMESFVVLYKAGPYQTTKTRMFLRLIEKGMAFKEAEQSMAVRVPYDGYANVVAI